MGIGDRILASTAGLGSAGRDEAPQADEGSPAAMARTAPGQMLAVHSGVIAMRAELQELQAKLKQFDRSMATRLLDPASIRPTRWANRHEASFSTNAFAGLKASIEQAGGNTQPILVRHPFAQRWRNREPVQGPRLDVGPGLADSVRRLRRNRTPWPAHGQLDSAIRQRKPPPDAGAVRRS